MRRKSPGFRVYISSKYCTQILWSKECKKTVRIPRMNFEASYWTHEVPSWVDDLWAIIHEKGRFIGEKGNEEVYWLPPDAKAQLLAIISKAKAKVSR